MRLLTSFLLLSLINSLYAADWSGIADCGTYQVRGVVRAPEKSGLHIVVNEKSQSEILVSVSIQDEAALAPYVDKAMEATMAFDKKSPGAKVKGSVKTINSRIPNPINPMDTGIKLISKAVCK